MGQGASAPTNPMRAVVRQGSELAYQDAYERPAAPKPDEVVVNVAAAAINPVDYKAPKMILGKIVGLDFAGTVAAIGEGATHGLEVGDAVYGTGPGSLADQLLVKASRIAKAPKDMPMPQVAAMPTTYLTSLQALRKGDLKTGGRALVIGASGGCGTAALQLARVMGAGEIVAVCSGKNAQFVEEHGATKVVDYTKEKLEDIYSAASDADKFDVVYDCATNSGAGEDYKATSMSLLCEGSADRPHGQYVAINGAATMWLRHLTIGQKQNEHLLLTDSNTADLDYLSNLAKEKKVTPVIDSTFPFTADGVAEAFTKLKSRRVVGKVVIDIQGESTK